jgi:hypothetical protein
MRVLSRLITVKPEPGQTLSATSTPHSRPLHGWLGSDGRRVRSLALDDPEAFGDDVLMLQQRRE